MPVELHVIRASEFIRLDARERLNLEATKEALRTLVQACRKRGLSCAMLDLRTLPIPAKPYFTTTEVSALVSTFREAGFSRAQRLAILYRYDVYGGIGNFAFLSRMRGLNVQTFSEFESALHWLSQEQATPAAPRSRGVAIPITTPSSEVKKVPASLITERPAHPIRRTARR